MARIKFNCHSQTELGKNWDLWQAFRELYCNTIDENGSIYTEDGDIEPIENKTIIEVDSEEFADIFEDRYNQVFLEDADTLSTSGVQIIAKPSDYIYYRGIRVFKTDKPCLNTYNILSHVTLTEDRTASSEWQIKDAIQDALKLEENSNILENALNCNENYFESDFNYYIYEEGDISESFKDVATNCSNQAVKSAVYKVSDEYRQKQEQEKQDNKEQHFCTDLIYYLKNDLYVDFNESCGKNKEELIEILENHLDDLF